MAALERDAVGVGVGVPVVVGDGVTAVPPPLVLAVMYELAVYGGTRLLVEQLATTLELVG